MYKLLLHRGLQFREFEWMKGWMEVLHKLLMFCIDLVVKNITKTIEILKQSYKDTQYVYVDKIFHSMDHLQIQES